MEDDASEYSQSQHLQDQEQKSTMAPIRTRRPHNSYLKILMDGSVFEELECLMHQFKNRWENRDYDSNNSELQEFHALSKVISDTAFKPSTDQFACVSTESNTENQNGLRPKLKIKTRSLQSLHMTYFFCGTILNEMPSDQLELLNSMLHERLRDIDNKDNSYYLKFKSIELFPPQRKNLIAGTFESSLALDELYQEVCDIAMTPKRDTEQREDNEYKHPFANMQKEYEFPSLRSAVFKEMKKRNQHRKRNNNISSWVPHVTLANIVGGKNSGIKELNSWLNKEQFDLKASSLYQDYITVNGLSLSEPYPENVDLDWSFPFNPKQR